MILEKLNKQIEKQIKTFPQHVNRISSIGFPCRRNLVFQITMWNEREAVSPDLQRIFNEGRHQERAIKKDLEEAGIAIIRQEEPIWLQEYNLSGHIDGIIQYRRSLTCLEIKSMSTHLFQKINTFSDLAYSPHAWHQCYTAQIQLYQYGTGIKKGIILIKDKNTGAIKEIESTLDNSLCRVYLDRCKDVMIRVNKIREVLQETYQIKEIADLDKKQDRADYLTIKAEAMKTIETYLPERTRDNGICNSCPYNHICLPDEIRQERIAVWINEELESLLDRREELKENHLEYNRIDTEVKDKIKEQPHDYITVGNYEITVSRGKRTLIDISKECSSN
jgi:CRISPR/Cas system-associated exonuclease Cas4 (RecB family)